MKKLLLILIPMILLAEASDTIRLYGMVKIPSGTFVKGLNPEDDKFPTEATYFYEVMSRQKITVDAFWMDTTEVTQKEYHRLMGKVSGKKRGDNLPVYNVNWNEAVLYCNARSKEAGLDTVYTYEDKRKLRDVSINYNANGFRLPTDAEWDYARRGATTTIFYWGNLPEEGRYVYENIAKTTAPTEFGDIFIRKYRDITPVASYKPNPFGLYDIIGNVTEWCNNWSDTTSQKPLSLHNPHGPKTGKQRVFCGKSFYDPVESYLPMESLTYHKYLYKKVSSYHINIYWRSALKQSTSPAHCGFRCVRNVTDKEK